MTRREMAGWLCRRVQVQRLDRIGEPIPPYEEDPLANMPEDERRNWLDMADAVLAFNSADHPVERLQELGRDWVRYTMQIAESRWRDEMRRAVVIEMRVEVEKLWKMCDGNG